MQWNVQPHAGFTTGKPWLAVNPNYQDINAEGAISNPDSVFNTYKALINLRKHNDWIIYGDFELLNSADEVFAYLRKYQGKKYLVVVNLSDQVNPFTTGFVPYKSVITNDKVRQEISQIELKPWEAFAYEVE